MHGETIRRSYLSVHRPKGVRECGAREYALCRVLMPRRPSSSTDIPLPRSRARDRVASLDQLAAGLFLVDAQGRILACNRIGDEGLPARRPLHRHRRDRRRNPRGDANTPRTDPPGDPWRGRPRRLRLAPPDFRKAGPRGPCDISRRGDRRGTPGRGGSRHRSDAVGLEICLHHVLLDHALRVEERTIQRDGVAHHLDETRHLRRRSEPPFPRACRRAIRRPSPRSPRPPRRSPSRSHPRCSPRSTSRRARSATARR